jgi:uncharacterized metal-binding protein YceD (DUF177 family)
MTIETSWIAAVTDVPEAGLRFTRSATEAERKAVAAALEILDCTALECDLRVRALRQGRYQVSGTVKGAVVQACSVTLEPLPAPIDETINVEFWPKDQVPRPSSTAQDEFLDPDAPDGAEPIENGKLGLGQIVYEYIAAGLDPYPRKPDATVEWRAKPEKTAEIHPFAALAKLKLKE